MSRAPAVVALPEADRFEDAPHPRETLGLSGHIEAEQELLDAYRRNRLAQAWIIGGPEGIGKATLAWRLARFLTAHPDPAAPQVQQAASLAVAADSFAARRVASLAVPDIFLLRRSWDDKGKKHYTEIRVDDVRKVIHALHQGSGAGGWRIAIVDAADELNRASANALLKLIEEPPERALFLLVAHQPGRLLPTIRSRCRKLMLSPLSPQSVSEAILALGPDYADRAGDVARAAELSEGSVRAALSLLDGDGMLFAQTVNALLERLPRIDWTGVHLLADKLTGRANEAAYERFMTALQRQMDARVRRLALEGAPPARMIGYARAWDEIRAAAAETETFNFDKRALVVGIFERLERAAQV